jgi:hypothetical protein
VTVQSQLTLSRVVSLYVTHWHSLIMSWQTSYRGLRTGLEKGCGGGFGGDRIWEGDGVGDGGRSVFGVGGGAHVGYAGVELEVGGGVGAEGGDCACDWVR